MKDKYNVVIIGADPAGLKCAEVLKDSNLEVLVLDKKEVIGPKICAGGLTSLTESFELPSGKYSEFKKQKIILNENIIGEFELINSLKTISRYDLGQHQLTKIRNFPNIEVQNKKLVSKIGSESIRLGDGEGVKFDFLIGADGAGSIVRKYLGLPSKFYVGYQFISPKTVKDFTWFLNPSKIKSGYGWIFPHKEFTSIGVYFNPEIVDNKLAKSYLEELMFKNSFEIENSKFEGSPTNVLYVGNKFGNIYLAGESSGLVSANTGEGISYALINAEDVSKNILGKSNFENTGKIIKFKKRQEGLMRLFDKMKNSRLQTEMFKIFISLLKKPKFQEWYGN